MAWSFSSERGKGSAMKSIRFLYRNECAHARERERERDPKNLSGIHNKRQKSRFNRRQNYASRARANKYTDTHTHTHTYTHREGKSYKRHGSLAR